ncbi:DUF5304 family protein, partial [Streptomyces roseus]|uniref:DUF5304 family protein n=1 Tax=Streptomyces roseus TaxID=66430 RepID=UPI0033CE0F51
MSEATDRPTDDDAWAKACAEDLAAERERRRAREGGPDGVADLVDDVGDVEEFDGLAAGEHGREAPQ